MSIALQRTKSRALKTIGMLYCGRKQLFGLHLLFFRPFFTYYVTSVQILVCLASIFFHGFGPIGIDHRERTASVLHTSVVLRQVSIYELENIWLGPKFSDLVHLGAKYAPCMRRDHQIYAEIEKERKAESQTGCCIFNDGIGCFQASENECPSFIATLVKWSKKTKGPLGRTSGAVCGQDPNYCDEPLSAPPSAWPDDISEWPMCRRRSHHIVPENERHLHCEITGHPCCILLHGQCRITTREYCDFVQGFYHANATLCSQVSCLSEVCGMLPFLRRDHPDQIYRLFLSLFLHAGLLHCFLTFLVHWFYMRDLEKLIGWSRMAVLYMGSGIGGNLVSAILMPYQPEVGPSGSLFGIFSFLPVILVEFRRIIAKPWGALRDLILFTLVLFLIGTLPWIDNWAHIFGFIFGLLISLGTCHTYSSCVCIYGPSHLNPTASQVKWEVLGLFCNLKMYTTFINIRSIKRWSENTSYNLQNNELLV
ncbi:unnamed protein product [Enterobius vermicularis]|uniref:Rhomboid domain-containing protein n=1 Tax=Enterobius vermicularis TaxID=51028 RepID=A0A0N4V0R8_ENTVE|nr:unnamed protein product [Enterobius vermicularis]